MDKRHIDVTDAFRVHTTAIEADVPTYTMPDGGVLESYGVAPGTYPFYGDGSYVMLAPLSAGKHEVAPHGMVDGGDWTFETTVVYHPTIR